jgi:hypothetical protein
MPITINGNGWAAITGTPNGNGITISSTVPQGTIVVLNGIEIDGAQAAYNGIEVDGPAAVTITNCILQNFTPDGAMHLYTGNGILLAPTTGTLNATIANTTASNNANAGIFYLPPSGSPSTNINVDHVVMDANTEGFSADLSSTSGGTVKITISNAEASSNPPTGNSGSGIAVNNPTSATLDVAIDNVTVSNNEFGIAVGGAVKALLGRSLITGNAFGVYNNTSSGGFYSYGDNRINLNGNDGYGTLNSSGTTYVTH